MSVVTKKERRDEVAMLAHAFTKSMAPAEAIATIKGLFGIREDDARDLIERGNELAEQSVAPAHPGDVGRVG